MLGWRQRKSRLSARGRRGSQSDSERPYLLRRMNEALLESMQPSALAEVGFYQGAVAVKEGCEYANLEIERIGGLKKVRRAAGAAKMERWR